MRLELFLVHYIDMVLNVSIPCILLFGCLGCVLFIFPVPHFVVPFLISYLIVSWCIISLYQPMCI